MQERLSNSPKTLELLLSDPPHFGARVVHISAHLPRRWLLLSWRSRPPTDDERVCSFQRLLGLPLDPLDQALARWHVMDQADDLARGPNAVMHIPTHKHLAAPLAAHKGRHVLKLAARALPLGLDSFLGDSVAKQPACVPPSPEHELRIRLVRLDDGDFDVVVDGRFDRAHEPRAHVDPICAQSQGGRETLPVREPAAGDKGDVQALPRPGQQDEVCDVALPHMPGALEPVDRQEIHAEVDGALGVPDRGAFVEDGAAGRFQLPDDRPGGVTGRFDNLDPFVYDGLRVAVVVWRDEGGEEGQVHAEGVRGHGPAALYLFSEVRGGGLR